MTPLSLSDKTKRNTLFNNVKLYRPLNCSHFLSFPSLLCTYIPTLTALQQTQWCMAAALMSMVVRYEFKAEMQTSHSELCWGNKLSPSSTTSSKPPDTQAFTRRNKVPLNLFSKQSRVPQNPIRPAGSRPDTSPVHLIPSSFFTVSTPPESHNLSVPSCRSPSNSLLDFCKAKRELKVFDSIFSSRAAISSPVLCLERSRL